MLKLDCQLLAAILIATCAATTTAQQNDPGMLDDLHAEYEPLIPQSTDIGAPLIMGPESDPERLPQLEPGPQSVLELPRVATDPQAPEALVLPELTLPTPANTRADQSQDRQALKPPVEGPIDGGVAGDDLQLVPWSEQEAGHQAPRLQAPRPLSHGSELSHQGEFDRLRTSLHVLPVQLEFFTVTRGFGYQPYGGYRSLNHPGRYGHAPRGGYLPYGGYRSRAGYGYGTRNCPNRW